MGQRFCEKCQKRHNTPTGKNCTRKIKFVPREVKEIGNLPPPPLMDAAGIPPTPTDVNLSDDPEIIIGTPAAATASLEDRMSNLETLLGKLSDNLMGAELDQRKSRPRHRSVSGSSADSGSYDRRRIRHRQPSPSKCLNPLSYESIFPDEELKVNNFEGVILALFKTLELYMDEDQDITGLISHGRFLAEKAVANVYVPETFVNFDKHVRSKVPKKGYESFDDISDLDKSRFFNLENYREVRALHARNKQSKKSNGTCRKFNGDGGCFAKSCQYVHRCAHCEVYGHSVKDCRAAQAEKSKK